MRQNSALGKINIVEIEIKNQYTVECDAGRGRIDIFVKLAYIGIDNLIKNALIVIEDKVDASITNQLAIYTNSLNSNKEYDLHEKYFVILKTGLYDLRGNVGVFKVYDQQDFLYVIEKYVDKNIILDDFRVNLLSIQNRLNRFKTNKLPEKFDPEYKYFLIGFHKWLLSQDELIDSQPVGYGYVNNAQGGFNGFWWNFEDCSNSLYKSYLQLENNELCFKIAFSLDKINELNWKDFAKTVKAKWSNILCEISSNLKSKHTKVGKTMTVAKMENFLSFNQHGIINLPETLLAMRNAEQIMFKARQSV